jgi:manganese transport protein
VKRVFEVFLGILTAFGGFVDIGDLVANAETGARFGMSLAWVVLVGVGGIVLFAEMAGRVATVSHRPVFDIVRERLGARLALVNLGASFFINFLTLAAEIGGLALVIELVTGLNYLFWIPLAAIAVALVIWKVRFSTMEKVFGLTGLALIVYAVAVWQLGPDWSGLWQAATHPSVPASESVPTFAFFGIALLGAAMTPYEVFFFSSGAIEEKWTERDLAKSRLNVLVGFPLGGILSIAIAGCAAVVLLPASIDVTSLSQVVLPVAEAGGKLALSFAIVGILAATFGAALETTLSSGYTLAQYFGWSWGKFRRPAKAARFHLAMIICILVAVAILSTGVDPILVTEYSVVFSAVALPLTYLPILIIANDREYMGDKVNGRGMNFIGSVYLVVILAAALAAIPLLIVTGAGA